MEKMSKNILLSRIYNTQQYGSKKRDHNQPDYSLIELKDWFWKQNNSEILYNNWVINGYNKWDRPSVDRIDDAKGYSFDNIRLITWGENHKKRITAQRKGILNTSKPHVSVSQYDLKNNFIMNFISMSAASRKTKVHQSHISSCCKGDRWTAGGFKWMYNN